MFPDDDDDDDGDDDDEPVWPTWAVAPLQGSILDVSTSIAYVNIHTPVIIEESNNSHRVYTRGSLSTKVSAASKRSPSEGKYEKKRKMSVSHKC
jgi:hypothetical protein